VGVHDTANCRAGPSGPVLFVSDLNPELWAARRLGGATGSGDAATLSRALSRSRVRLEAAPFRCVRAAGIPPPQTLLRALGIRSLCRRPPALTRRHPNGTRTRLKLAVSRPPTAQDWPQILAASSCSPAAPNGPRPIYKTPASVPQKQPEAPLCRPRPGQICSPWAASRSRLASGECGPNCGAPDAQVPLPGGLGGAQGAEWLARRPSNRAQTRCLVSPVAGC